MTTIEQIKAEIERRIIYAIGFRDNVEQEERASFFNGEAVALKHLLSFLDTLESETTYDTQQYNPRPSVGIEDVARVQFASHAKVFDKKRKAIFDWEQFKEVASIFYGFGKKDSSSTLESEKPMNQDELEEEIERYLPKIPENPYNEELRVFARHFAKWGYLRAAEKYDEIEYNRQRAEENEKPSVEDAMKELNEKIALVKERGTWEGVDVDKYMDEVRGREPEKSMNLEEEINRYLREECSDDDEPGIHEHAEHFAKWGAEHLKK